MSISFDKVFGVHENAVLLRSKRAEILANNIANADTPGFKARDINFAEALRNLKEDNISSDLATTDNNHISDNGNIVTGSELIYRKPSQASLDGNTVEDQKEKALFMQNSIEYMASLNFLNSKLKSLVFALRGE